MKFIECSPYLLLAMIWLGLGIVQVVAYLFVASGFQLKVSAKRHLIRSASLICSK